MPSNPVFPGASDQGRASSVAAMKIFPAWMYDDPAIAVERIESIELRAAARVRVREIAQEQELDRMQQSTVAKMVFVFRRAILAPPEIRMKRARIQALTRAAMKGLK